MKAICSLVILVTMIMCQSAFGQASPMYDPAYAGPMNMYGQPTFDQGAAQQARTNQQQQQQFRGLFPMAFDGLYGAGSYLWGYMPAPVRGVESPYAVPPGSGQVITNFVPGTR